MQHVAIADRHRSPLTAKCVGVNVGVAGMSLSDNPARTITYLRRLADGAALVLDPQPADIQNQIGAGPVLRLSRRTFPFIAKAFADACYAGDKPATATIITVEIVRKPSDQGGFVVHPRRRVVVRRTILPIRRSSGPLAFHASSWLTALEPVAVGGQPARWLAPDRPAWRRPRRPRSRIWARSYSAMTPWICSSRSSSAGLAPIGRLRKITETPARRNSSMSRA